MSILSLLIGPYETVWDEATSLRVRIDASSEEQFCDAPRVNVTMVQTMFLNYTRKVHQNKKNGIIYSPTYC